MFAESKFVKRYDLRKYDHRKVTLMSRIKQTNKTKVDQLMGQQAIFGC